MSRPPALAPTPAERRLRPTALLAAVLCLAAGGSSDITQGLSLYEALEYDRAVVILGRALGRDDLGEDERTQGLQTLAFCYVVLDDDEQAEETFHALFDHHPAHRLGVDASPRLSQAYDHARATWAAGRRIQLDASAHGSMVSVTLTGDPRRVGRVVTVAGDRRAALVCQRDRCEGARPPEEFTVTALDHRGTPLATSTALPGAGASVPTWMIWAAVGIAVIAGGVAAGVAISRPGDPPEGNLGTLRLP